MSQDKCLLMVSPESPFGLCQVSLPKHKVEVDLDPSPSSSSSFSIDHVLCPTKLISLTSIHSTVLLDPDQEVSPTTQRLTLSPDRHWNLTHGECPPPKVRVSAVTSTPVTAGRVHVALIRSGYFRVVDFKEYLRLYFTSPKILHVGNVFALDIPRYVPTAISLEEFMGFARRQRNFRMDTYRVHFRVVKAEAAGDPGSEITGFFFMSSKVTALYQVSDEGGKIPCWISDRAEDVYYREEVRRCVDILRDDSSSRSILLVGQRGSCKRGLVRCIAGRLHRGVYPLRGVDYSGEAPGSLHTRFQQVATQITKCTPCLLHLDNLELLGRTRDGSGADPRVIMAITDLIDNQLRDLDVKIIGSCSRADDVLLSLRFLFDRTCVIHPRQTDENTEYLKTCLEFEGKFDVGIASSGGFRNLHDLKTFVRAAERRLEMGYISNGKISEDDFRDIMNEDIGHLVNREAKSTGIPSTSWSDIGGISHVRKEVEETIELPLKYPELFGGDVKRSGLLLHGTPGCGKTMVARAIASQCNLHFITVQGPELLNSFVGQSEDNVRKVFERARAMAPTVLFFDEIDAIAPKRSGGVLDRVLAQVLSEMDGIQESGQVFMIGATNRPELIDPALTRPGRLDKKVHVTVGRDVDSRTEVFDALARKLNLDEGVNFRTISEISGPLSGAECFGVLLGACYGAIERCIKNGESTVRVKQNDLIHCVMNRLG